MELKKNPEADIKRKSLTFFQIGLLVSLFVVLGAFKYTVYEIKRKVKITGKIEDLTEVMENTTQPNTPPPPPPTPTLEVTDDENEVDPNPLPPPDDPDKPIPPPAPPAPPAPEEPKGPEIFTIVEDMPEFPGGEDKLYDYLGKNLKYPREAQNNEIEGMVIVQFVVDEEGNITSPKIVKSVGFGCDEEALRVVKSMPQWKPGKQRNKAVKVYYNLPIMFQF